SRFELDLDRSGVVAANPFERSDQPCCKRVVRIDGQCALVERLRFLEQSDMPEDGGQSIEALAEIRPFRQCGSDLPDRVLVLESGLWHPGQAPADITPFRHIRIELQRTL